MPEHTGELAAITAAFRSLPAADRELLALFALGGRLIRRRGRPGWRPPGGLVALM